MLNTRGGAEQAWACYAPKLAYYAFWHFPNILPIMLVLLCFLNMRYADNFYLIRMNQEFQEQLQNKSFIKIFFIMSKLLSVYNFIAILIFT